MFPGGPRDACPLQRHRFPETGKPGRAASTRPLLNHCNA